QSSSRVDPHDAATRVNELRQRMVMPVTAKTWRVGSLYHFYSRVARTHCAGLFRPAPHKDVRLAMVVVTFTPIPYGSKWRIFASPVLTAPEGAAVCQVKVPDWFKLR